MLEEAPRISSGHRRKCPTDGIYECRPAPSLGPSQQRLGLRESFFYRVEVRRVGWQEHKLAASSLYQLTHPIALMGGEVIEHYHLTGA